MKKWLFSKCSQFSDYFSENRKQFLAIIFIIALTISDFSTLYSMLSDAELDLNIVSVIIISFVLALCLEGLPTIGGQAYAVLKDKTDYKVNNHHVAKTTVIISLIGFSLTVIILIGLRILIMIQKGWINAFLSKEYSTFATDAFMGVQPIITSILAFAVSYFLLDIDNSRVLRKSLKRMDHQYVKQKEKYSQISNQLNTLKSALWTSITNHKDIPDQAEIFKEEVMKRIRKKFIEECVIFYPHQIMYYNAQIENAFRNYLLEICNHTTIPLLINKIDINEVIQEYDKLLQDKKILGKTPWNYNLCKDQLVEELKTLIDNSIVVSQTKIRTGYPVEGKDLK